MSFHPVGTISSDMMTPRLYQFLADRVAKMSAENMVIVTKGSAVFSTHEADLEGLDKCTHQQADSSIFLHARYASVHGTKNITHNQS